jgi:hypothetical protein
MKGGVRRIPQFSCNREGGRYVSGSGNSIANYIPGQNYLIMIDEFLNW